MQCLFGRDGLQTGPEVIGRLQPVEASDHGDRRASAGALFQGITAPRRDWIDAAVGRDAEVAVVWSGRTDAFTVWENEFFNRSVGPVYHLSGPVPGGLAQAQVAVDPDDGLLRDSEGRPIEARHALIDASTFLAGRPVARDDGKGLVVYAPGAVIPSGPQNASLRSCSG